MKDLPVEYVLDDSNFAITADDTKPNGERPNVVKPSGEGNWTLGSEWFFEGRWFWAWCRSEKKVERPNLPSPNREHVPLIWKEIREQYVGFKWLDEVTNDGRSWYRITESDR